MKNVGWRRTRLLKKLCENFVNRKAAIWGGATLLSMVFSALAFSLAPIALAKWIGKITAPDFYSLAIPFGAYLFLYLVGFLSRDLQWALFSRFEREVHFNLANMLLKKTLNSSEEAGNLGQITTTLYGVQNFLFCVAFIILPFSMEALGMLIAATSAISWMVGGLLLVFTAGFLLILNWSTERTSQHNRKMIKAGNNAVNFLSSAFDRRKLVQRSRAQGFMEEKLNELVAKREIERIQFGGTRTLTTWVLDCWVVLCLLANLSLSIYLIRTQVLGIGEAVAVESFFFQLMRRLEVWARGFRDSAISSDQCEDLFHWLENKEKAHTQSSEVNPEHFPTPKTSRWTVLTGATGVGKTTFLHRRFDASPDGKALVPQQAEVLPLSIYDNLMMGKSIPPETLNQVLEGLELISVITRLPEGLQTTLAPNGYPLSGGETQRLCLARSLLERPQELLLDEPTSAQSEEQEASLLNFVRSFLPNLTLVAVTHRPALKRLADDHWHVETWNRIRIEQKS